MAKITVVGLGPGGYDYLTLKAYNTLKNAKFNYTRTLKHPIIDDLKKEGIKFNSFDNVYEKFEEFDLVYKEISNELLILAEKFGHIVYSVPGNPFVAERTVELLIENSEDNDLEFIHGTSFIDAIITSLKKDPVHGLKVLNGLEIQSLDIDVDVDSIIIQTYDDIVSSNVKLKLMEYFDDEHMITIIRGAGIPNEEKIINIPLYELDRIEIMDHLTSIYVPKRSKNVDKRYFFKDLLDIMKKLRSIDGCPWDREQTHQSLKEYLLEETYEVIEAIENEDLYLLEEELGDLLLQVVFHSTIASENGYFNINDVTTGISEKLINRHPHVFADVNVKDSKEVLKNWEELKKEEKGEKTVYESMERISKSLPALIRSYKIQKKAKDVGFDWDNVDGAFEKLDEEIEELKVAVKNNNLDEIENELGDVLFTVVNIFRFFNINPEFALNHTIDKFLKRFKYMEEKIIESNNEFQQVGIEFMEKLWNEAKKEENL